MDSIEIIHFVRISMKRRLDLYSYLNAHGFGAIAHRKHTDLGQESHNLVVLDRAAVARLLPRNVGFDLAALALKETSLRRCVQPNRMIIPVSEQNGAVLSVMAGVLQKPLLVGAKISAVMPENRYRGLPGHHGAVVLMDSDTGRLVAVLHGGEITARRTAAATAVATRTLARRNSRVLALIGSGEQASHHLDALLQCMPIEEVRIWSLSRERASTFAENHSGTIAKIIPHDRVEAAIEGADIICTLTSAPTPVLLGRFLKPGQHVNAVGSSVRQFREIDDEAVARAKFYGDFLPMLQAEGGEYLSALSNGAISADHVVGEIGEVLLGTKPGRQSETEITLFKSLGIIAEDLTAARYAVTKALAENCGSHVAFE
jgi:ornithine cyclodeaminase/alanine dehydrogenase-like protein (mu-crystallin family)